VQAELHTEVRHTREAGRAARAPGRRGAIPLAGIPERLQVAKETRVTGKTLEPLERDVLQQEPWILRAFPERLVQLLPNPIAGVIPRPMQIERERGQARQRLWKRTRC
jgi:hypothetical protein